MKFRDKLLVFLLALAALINLVATFGPELGFDALWYHLTIPKIYLMWGKIDFIPGGLMYYSAMPRLGEFLFLAAIKVLGNNGDIGAHLISWGAGVGSAWITYKIARKYLNQTFSLMAALIFYATPLVGWQSGSAYVDLLRTFWEILALYLFLSKKTLWAGIAMGLAISTKTLALGSAGILLGLGVMMKYKPKDFLKFLTPVVLISMPWFAWAWQKTGYPFYPLGAGILNTNERMNFLSLFTQDKINPVLFLALPWVNRKYTALILYALLGFVFWLVTPQNGGGRFLLPYLPVFAVLAAGTFQKYKLLLITAVIIVIGSIGYRAAANVKVVPYIFGQETRTQYLCSRLDFSTRVFADCDGWFAQNIKPTDLVLVRGFHNLYYVDFPFIHESWYKGEEVNYIVTYRAGSKEGKPVYANALTGAIVYKL